MFRDMWYNDRMKAIFFFLFFVFSLSTPVFVPSVAFADDDDQEDEIADTKGDLKEIEKDLEKAEKERDALAAEASSIASSISVVSSAISRTQAVIEETEETIDRKEAEIRALEEDADRNRSILARLILEAYYQGAEFALPEILSEENMFRALNEPGQLQSMSERIRGILANVRELRETIAEEKAELEGVKQEKEELLEMKEAQKNELAREHAETRSELVEQEATIGELRAKLVELQSDLAVLTGRAYDAKDIREAVEFASKKTDVPKGVLYGFLKMETNLGANTGQCTYKQVKKDAIDRWYGSSSKYKNSRALLEKRMDLFYDLVDDLGYSKNKKVSCTPSGYVGQGGAMGVSQFMSDVWNGYQSQVAAATGHKTPDPWNLTDGVMAMALKLEKAGATSSKESVIERASINYLGSYYKPYYEGIVYWSKNYKKLFD